MARVALDEPAALTFLGTGGGGAPGQRGI